MQGVSGFSGSDSGVLQLAHFFSGTEADDCDASAVVPEQLSDDVPYYGTSLSPRAINLRVKDSATRPTYLLMESSVSPPFCMTDRLLDIWCVAIPLGVTFAEDKFWPPQPHRPPSQKSATRRVSGLTTTSFTSCCLTQGQWLCYGGQREIILRMTVRLRLIGRSI